MRTGNQGASNRNTSSAQSALRTIQDGGRENFETAARGFFGGRKQKKIIDVLQTI